MTLYKHLNKRLNPKKHKSGNREGLINNSFKRGGLNPLKLYIMLKFKGLIPFKHSIEK